jgi:phosphoribosylglycinamide formyltransferase-1
MKMKKIAVFASGSGTNASNIISYFSTVKTAKVTAVYVNNPEAYVIKRVEGTGVDIMIFDRHDFYESGNVLERLQKTETDIIVLAGFLWLVPADIIVAFRGRIVNVHPALLPDFGGKGMYGNRVHAAVIEAGVSRSGITIHYVNEHYDSGDIIFQKECEVLHDDTSDTLAARIHQLEYRYYPAVIEELLTAPSSVDE